MTNISAALQDATVMLAAYENARLEAELLLAHVLSCSRTYLYTEPHQALSSSQHQQFFALTQRRVQGEPIAYLLGVREFWSLPLEVNAATLIPRPETELLVEIALQHLSKDSDLEIADLGTGSGAIALALAKERSLWQITATDQSQAALDVAQQNAQRLKLHNVRFYRGDWCDALPRQQKFHAILSNPPYIPLDDPHLKQGDLRFEPQTALSSGVDGLTAIRVIIQRAKEYLLPGGWLWLEHGYDQGEKVRDLLRDAGYQSVQTFRDLAGVERVSGGC